jgi:hypothetical protein
MPTSLYVVWIALTSTLFQRHPTEMVIQELKRYSVNPELEFQVIDCITNILNVGRQGNRKETDIWTIINLFTSAMTKAQDEGLESILACIKTM